MGIDYSEDGVIVRTGRGWALITEKDAEAAETAAEAAVDPLANNGAQLDSVGPQSKAGQEYLRRLEAHNATTRQTV